MQYAILVCDAPFPEGYENRERLTNTLAIVKQIANSTKGAIGLAGNCLVLPLCNAGRC